MKTRKLWRKLAWMALQAESEEASKSYSNLENADPELCIKLLQHQSVHNFLGIRKKIENSDDDWMQVNSLHFCIFYDSKGCKSELELKSNSSEISPVNCTFICFQIFLFCVEI